MEVATAMTLGGEPGTLGARGLYPHAHLLQNSRDERSPPSALGELRLRLPGELLTGVPAATPELWNFAGFTGLM